VQAGRGGGHLFAKPAIGLDTAAIEQMFFVLGDEACYVLLSAIQELIYTVGVLNRSDARNTGAVAEIGKPSDLRAHIVAPWQSSCSRMRGSSAWWC
jgi:hypothetical protein